MNKRSMTLSEKIIALDTLAERCLALRAEGYRVVLCHGVFDLVHPGHVKHIELAREQGDYLVVTITADRFVSKGPGRPVFNQRLRAETLAALQAVDYVAVVEEPTAISAIETVQPDTYVKGIDYANAEDDLTGKIVEEREAVERFGGVVVFTDEEAFSSTALLNRHFNILPEQVQRYLDFLRMEHPLDQMLRYFEAIQDKRVLVIGDAIVDEYIYCEPMGKSSKEYLVSTKYVGREQFAGGIHAVANHVSGVCREVTLITVNGDDEPADFLASKLRPNVSQRVIRSGRLPTTVKSRFVDRPFLQKLFQICTIEDDGLPTEDERLFRQALEFEIATHDLVIVADFGHGLLDSRSRAFIAEQAPFLALNVQTNSANVGFNLVTSYPRAGYVSIDEPEARFAMGERTADIRTVATDLALKMSSEVLSITRGHRGSLVLARGQAPELAPALASDVVDRIGAGDAFLAISSPFAAAGVDPAVVGFIGNAAGALAVRTVGNREPVDPVALKKFITTLLR